MFLVSSGMLGLPPLFSCPCSSIVSLLIKEHCTESLVWTLMRLAVPSQNAASGDSCLLFPVASLRDLGHPQSLGNSPSPIAHWQAVLSFPAHCMLFLWVLAFVIIPTLFLLVSLHLSRQPSWTWGFGPHPLHGKQPYVFCSNRQPFQHSLVSVAVC
jgi:hypothetical protein